MQHAALGRSDMVGPVDEFPCPFEEYTTRVLPEWIDLNGHMNMAYYGIVFDRGNYAAGDALGLGADYIDRCSHGIFAAETHTLYFRELHLGDLLSVRTQIVSADSKATALCARNLSQRDVGAGCCTGGHVPARRSHDTTRRSVPGRRSNRNCSSSQGA
jgi:acyl-CoA thioesterase FadM